MKYCVTLLLRKFDTYCNAPILTSRYYTCFNFRDLNDWIFHHVCNTDENKEIINFYFEVES